MDAVILSPNADVECHNRIRFYLLGSFVVLLKFAFCSIFFSWIFLVAM